MVERDEAGPAPSILSSIGRFLFRHRSYTPLPLIVLLLLFARPSILSSLAALPLVATGVVIRLRALQYIGGKSRSTQVGGDRLIRDGPFGVIRNPLYAGNLFLTGGISFFAGLPAFLLVPLVLFPIQYFPIIAAEEEELCQRFGGAYASYMASVPRLFPRSLRLSSARTGGGGPRHSLLEAIRADRRVYSTLLLLAVILPIVSAARGA